MKTNPVIANLGTNATPSAGDDIRAIKAPIEIPSGWTWVWWTLIALALGLLGWRAWRRWRTKAPATVSQPVVPSHERARERLREALALITQPRPFCISVSDAIRTYLEECFDFRAPERTTEEFLDELRASALLTLDQKQTLGEFLARCDLVKFARYEPGEAELRNLYDAAVRLVDETEPSPQTNQPVAASVPIETST
ncbi:MAG: hypothetical protein FJ403_04730 [Verrucomicrobia bacterium]|nr:hypothetical protein [Verrucomicrobiota bacterium]